MFASKEGGVVVIVNPPSAHVCERGRWGDGTCARLMFASEEGGVGCLWCAEQNPHAGIADVWLSVLLLVVVWKWVLVNCWLWSESG